MSSSTDDNIRIVLKIYDSDEDNKLTLAEFGAFCKDVIYQFTDVEKDMFGLNVEPITYDQIINAINYVPYDSSDKKFYEVLKKLDTDNTNKVFIPVLINILKHSADLKDNGRLDELLSLLPIEDNYLLLDKILFTK